MRDVAIYNHPVTVPGVCGKCGSQDRDWFVDLGFDTIFNQEPDSIGTPTWTDGTIYLCSDCYCNLIDDVNRRFGQFLHDVPVTHRNYTIPVGLVDDFKDIVESKYPKVEEEPVGEVEYFEEEEELNGHDGDSTTESDATAESLGEDDREPESDDFGFRIEVESAELVDG